MAKQGKTIKRARKGGGHSFRISAQVGGRQVRKTFRTAAAAAVWKRGVESAKDRGEVPIAPGATWEDMTAAWRSAKAGKASYNLDLGMLANHLDPVFAGLRLRDIDSNRIDGLAASLRADGYAPATQVQVLGLLRAMFRNVIAPRVPALIGRDQIPHVPIPNVPQQEWSFIETDEAIDAMLSAALDHRAGDLLHPLYATAAFTGMRCSELCALRLGDVSIERGQITIARSGKAGTTKSGKIRHAPILAPLLPILTVHLAARVESGAKPDDYVFQNGAGSQLFRTDPAFRATQGEGSCWFREVKETAGLPAGLTFHDLRHTFASHAAMAGRSLYWIQSILGHSDSKMTERYSHLDPSKRGGRVHDCQMFRELAPAPSPSPAAPTSTKVAGLLEWVESFRTAQGREPSEAEIIARLLGVA